MFTVTVEAENLEKLFTQMAELLKAHQTTPGVTHACPNDLYSRYEEAVEPSQTLAAKKRGRPKKDSTPDQQAPQPTENVLGGIDTEAQVQEEESDASDSSEDTQAAQAIEEVAAEPIVSREEVAKALTAVNTAKGIAAAKALLAKHGAMRISELKESDFGAFVADCYKRVVRAD